MTHNICIFHNYTKIQVEDMHEGFKYNFTAVALE